MPSALHAALVNDRFGDAAVYVRWPFERAALLFDLGDLAPLSPRQLIGIEHIFVSHAHVDHLFGFDRLLRFLVGREKVLRLWGPACFAERVHHKLQSYQWNLAPQFRHDLVFIVGEFDGAGSARRTRFGLKNGFAPEALDAVAVDDGVILRTPGYEVRAAVLDHQISCLGFALEETARANVWKPRLAELGLPVGAWLRDVKQAILDGRPDDHLVAVPGADGSQRTALLGELRHIVTVTPGPKIAYVTDVADTEANRMAIIALARDADILFIEAAFAAEDAAVAAGRAHLTTTAAGEIARAAGAHRVEPFHFSARYKGEEARMLSEVMAAFAGEGEPRTGGS